MSAMRAALWLALAVLFSQDCENGEGSVLELVLTLWCYRPRLKIPLLALSKYGCYCGSGGSGSPLDAVDQCCLRHDCCYRHARVALKCHSRVKWKRYKLSCRSSETECHSITLCGRAACECDKQLAECLTGAKPKRKFYNREDLCRGPKDPCPTIHQNWTETSHQGSPSTPSN